jgi:hypothetical protein
MLKRGAPDLDREIDRAIGEALPPRRKSLARQFIHNCLRVIEDYATDPTHSYWWAKGLLDFGADWHKYLVAAIIESFRESVLFDICDVRVVEHPASEAVLRRRIPISYDGSDGIAYRVERSPIYVGTRQIACWRSLLERRHHIGSVNFWFEFVRQMFDQETDSILSGARASYMHTGQPGIRCATAPIGSALRTIETLSHEVEVVLGGRPANHILVGAEIAPELPIEPLPDYKPRNGLHRAGRLCDRWNIYFDPRVSANEALLWRYHPDDGDTGASNFLYSIGFTTDFQTATIRSTQRVTSDCYYRVLRLE